MRPRLVAWLAVSLLLGSAINQASADSCLADLDQSGVVNGFDLAMLLGQWGICSPSLPGRGQGGGSSATDSTSPCPADLDASGSVNGFDLGILLGAWGKCPASTPPEITYVHVAHEGDTPPGIPLPGAFYDLLNVPQIDAAGNVLFKPFLGSPGLGDLGNLAIFYGPPGNIQKVIWETEPAPDLPPGVIIKNLIGANERVCETGQITFGAELAGPGVIPIDTSGPYPGAPGGGNDWGLFIANPSRGQPPRLLLRSGDPAPGLPGFTIGPDDFHNYFALEQSDNGTLVLVGMLSGPGVNDDNDVAWWTGFENNLQLVWREGMPAPGTPEGVVFDWADFITVNDLGEMAFRGHLAGPGIVDGMNYQGRWIGGPGSLHLVAWQGLPVAGAPRGSTVALLQGGPTCTNNHGDMNAHVLLGGPGVSALDNMALFAGPPAAMHLIAREGDPVLEAGPGVEIDGVGNSYMNDLGEIMYPVRLRGPSVTLANQWCMFFGTYEQSSMTLRSGDPAPWEPDGSVTMSAVLGLNAMNDVGNIVTMVEIDAPGITSQNATVALLRDPVNKQWQPIIQGGMTLDSRTVSLPEYSDLGFWWHSGGSDGYGLSLNDSGQFVVQIPFTDGTDGIFIVQQVPASK